MLPLPWRSLIVFLGCVIALALCIEPEQGANSFKFLSASAVIQHLEGDSEATRKAARLELLRRGNAVMADLVKGAKSYSPSVTREIVGILEEFLIQPDLAVANSAERALLDLQETGHRELSILCGQILSNHATVRQSRAVARLEELGAVIGSADPFHHDRQSFLSPDFLIFDHRWKGGQAGLDAIKRLVRPTFLHFDESLKILREEIHQVAAGNPQLHLRWPSDGCLGIGGASCEDGFLVSTIIPGSPAAHSGLRAGDKIKRLNGTSTGSFEALSELITSFPPRETILLDIERKECWQVLPVVLGSDFATGRCRCVEAVQSVSAVSVLPLLRLEPIAEVPAISRVSLPDRAAQRDETHISAKR